MVSETMTKTTFSMIQQILKDFLKKLSSSKKQFGQNYLLTTFVKTNFPNLSIFVAYINTNFAITQS